MDYDTDIKPILTSVVRHAMTLLAGALAMWGWKLSAGQTAQFESEGAAVVLYLLGQAWSWWQKRKQVKAVVVAAATGLTK